MYYIYRITNLINRKTYIGQHKYRNLNDDYMGSGVLIRKAINKYGKENFVKEILYSNIQYKETADDMECFAIAKERALGKAEYNLTDGGEGRKGYKASEKARKNMSEAHKGKKQSEVLVEKRVEARKGYRHSEETKRKIGEANKISLSGKHLSDETKRKIGEANKGKKRSEEFKKKMSEIHKGQTSWNKGKKLSEEAKRKMVESHQKKAAAYKEYKLNGGTLKWNEFQKEYKNIIGENKYGYKKWFLEFGFGRPCLQCR